jgi:SAM-dependent methyltransferase
MLKEHLNQSHDRASRRYEIIDQQVEWIHQVLLEDEAVPILDLACGPGLYASRLVKYGHPYRGIDFSPASIEHAQQMTQPEQTQCAFELNDIRNAEYGNGYGLVMLISGEFTVFRPSDGQRIIQKAFDALKPGGLFLLEVSTCEAVYDLGNSDSAWYTSPAGLFSDQAHLVLIESFYNADHSVATNRYYVVDVATSKVSRYSVNYQGYTHSDFQRMLRSAGFEEIQFKDSLNPQHPSDQNEFIVVTAQKPR